MPTQAKNVLIVCHYYPPHIGGIEIVAYNQAKQLALAGHKVTVVTSKVHSKEKNCYLGGVDIVRIKAWNFFERWGIPFPIFAPRMLLTLLKLSKRADVIHMHDAFYMSSFLAALCGCWHRKPMCLTQHVAMITHPSRLVTIIQKVVYATSGAAIFRLSNNIFIFNDKVEKFLLDRGVSQSKLISLPNGVDTELFHPVGKEEKTALRKQLGFSQNKKIILFVGRFVPKKGFDKVLAARNDEYQIVFAGGDAPQDSDDEIIFLGKLSQKKLAQVYQASDIFVLPSHGEGFPLSIQEAMASGLPVITTKDEGYMRYNLDENYVCLIDNPTKDSVCQSIKILMKDDDLLRKMSGYSYRYARDNFSWPLIVSRLEKIYNDLVIT